MTVQAPGLPVTMSPGQRSLWFTQQRHPGTAAYHIGFFVRILSGLDADILRRSLGMLMARHPMLRSRFRSGPLGPEAWIVDEADPAFTVHDAGGLDDQGLRDRVRAAYKAPFALESGPLVRADLFVRAADDAVLALAIHHLTCDAWSLFQLLEELRLVYPALVRDGIPQLPALLATYPELMASQTRWLEGDRGRDALTWWRQLLDPEPPALELPTDRVRPSEPELTGDHISFELPVDLSRSLRDLAGRENTSVFTVLLAAWFILLHRLSGQHDLCTGIPLSGRDKGDAGVVGNFANLAAIRQPVDRTTTPAGLIRDLRRKMLGALVRGRVPFPTLVESLRLERRANRHPLFQTTFSFQQPVGSQLDLATLLVGTEPVRVDWGGMTWETWLLAQQEGQVDLALELVDGLPFIGGYLKFDPALFDPATITRWAGYLRTIAERMVQQPTARIASWTLPDADELRRLTVWAGGQEHLAVTRPLHRLIEAWVARNPLAVAVRDPQDALTYGELNRRANRLARSLQARGAGPEQMVGICLERSLDLAIALLAVLKSGAAYLPVDPTWPAERIADILADADPMIVLTEAALGDRVGPRRGVVMMDRHPTDDDSQAEDDLDLPIGPQHPCYVIYTSGSTGKPKGTLITHGNIVRLLDATQRRFRFGSRDVWTVFHSFAFDFSVWEFWGALAFGGTALLVPYALSRSADGFRALLARGGVTILNQTPSAFRQLIHADAQAPGAGDLHLRLVILGGEALEPQTLRSWFDRRGDQHPRIVNMYGITETTVHVTWRRIRAADAGRGINLIGESLPDLSLRILNVAGREAPIGVLGSIHVSGAGLARGYRNHPGLTVRRFLPDGFGIRPGARRYDSGDLGRRTSDGDLIYAGRADFQVKIRGFRIELGDIESHLIAHPAIDEAVVLAVDDNAGGKRLVAYVVPGGQAPDSDQLMTYLLARLPHYMVPTAFVVLSVLPLTSNGKLDRSALLAQPSAPAARAVASLSPDQARLADLWRELLPDAPEPGPDSDFFRLGGHSILATRLIQRIRDDWGVDLPVSGVFAAPTIAQMAERLARLTANACRADVVL